MLPKVTVVQTEKPEAEASTSNFKEPETRTKESGWQPSSREASKQNKSSIILFNLTHEYNLIATHELFKLITIREVHKV